MRRRVIASILVLVALPVPTATSKPGCRKVKGPGHWSTFQAPRFRDGSRAIVDYAVSPKTPRRIFVANEREVHRSDDAGCRFKRVFSITGGPVSEPVPSRITRLALSESSPNVLYVGLEGGEVRPLIHVVKTTNAGRKWKSVDSGLAEAYGAPLMMAVAPSDPRTVYMFGREALISHDAAKARTGWDLYLTHGGDSWRDIGRLGRGVELSTSDGHHLCPLNAASALGPDCYTFSRMVVDPMKPRELWLYGESRYGTPTVFRARDADEGRFEAYGYGPTQATALDVYRSRRRYLVASSDGADAPRANGLPSGSQLWIYRSPDDSRWSPIPIPWTMTGWIFGRDMDEVFFTTVDGGAFYQRRNKNLALNPRSVTPRGAPKFDEISGGGVAGKMVVYARRGNVFYRWTP